MNFNYLFYIGALLMVAQLFLYQLKTFNSKNVKQCFKIFKSNNLFGFIVLLSIFLGKLNI
tara:strand:- start:266 stop:445 length:180 start_codon:yes stop_codon:yes gene_type:complete